MLGHIINANVPKSLYIPEIFTKNNQQQRSQLLYERIQ